MHNILFHKNNFPYSIDLISTIPNLKLKTILLFVMYIYLIPYKNHKNFITDLNYSYTIKKANNINFLGY